MIQWPPHSKVTCFDSSGKTIAKSTRSRLDLSDSLMLNYYGDKPFLCTIEVSTKDVNWTTWNSDNLRRVEDRIEYDLTFDGYKVKITRLEKPSRALCRKPFRWGLEIEGDYGEEAVFGKSRATTGTRFKVARSDASVKTIQLQIEKVFGLPRGCVSLLMPESKIANPRLTIKRLKNLWKAG